MIVSKHFDIDYVDCSGLDCFIRCPFRYMLSRLIGAKQRDAQAIYLDYGKIMHECLPLCYTHTLQEVWDTFDRLWSQSAWEGSDDPKRNPDTAKLLLENFWKSHQPDVCPYTLEHHH